MTSEYLDRHHPLCVPTICVLVDHNQQYILKRHCRDWPFKDRQDAYATSLFPLSSRFRMAGGNLTET